MKKKLYLLAISSGIFFFVLALYFFGHAMWDFHDDVNNFGIAYKFFAAKICAIFGLLLMTSVLFNVVERFVFAPLIILISGAIVLLVGFYVVKDEPWRFQYVDEVGFRVPRGYASGLGNEAPGAALMAVICIDDLSPARKQNGEHCEDTYFYLAHTTFPFYRVLSQDRETSCTTYSGGESCRSTIDTEMGQLNYGVKSLDVSPLDAEQYERRLLELINSWRIEKNANALKQ